MLQDIRYAARMLVKWRWMTAVAVLALALGIGANSAVFTFVNAVLLRGVPFPDPDEVVAIGTPVRSDSSEIRIRRSSGLDVWIVLLSNGG